MPNGGGWQHESHKFIEAMLILEAAFQKAVKREQDKSKAKRKK